jgi:hypothetical protein
MRAFAGFVVGTILVGLIALNFAPVRAIEVTLMVAGTIALCLTFNWAMGEVFDK